MLSPEFIVTEGRNEDLKKSEDDKLCIQKNFMSVKWDNHNIFSPPVGLFILLDKSCTNNFQTPCISVWAHTCK